LLLGNAATAAWPPLVARRLHIEDGADLVGAAKVLSELGRDGILDHGVLLVFEVDVVARIVLMDACFMYTIPCSLKLMGSDGGGTWNCLIPSET
jgi:hypothetical protein